MTAVSVILSGPLVDRPATRHSMRFPTLCLSLALTLAALAGSPPLAAQSLADPLVSSGRARVSGGGEFLSWRDRFGLDGRREPLATDLTRESAASLFPGLGALETALDALLEPGTFPLRLGASRGFVSQNQVRVPLSVDVGITDRITVGVTVPLVRTTVEADLFVRTDSTASLGANPAVVAQVAVAGFLDVLRTRRDDVTAAASQLCTSDPGSNACADATALAADLSSSATLLGQAYGASALFPAAGSQAGEALIGQFAALDAALAAQGHSELGAPPPLATPPLTTADLQALLADPGGPFAAAPVESFGGLWGVGDVEARVAAQLLRGARVDSLGVPSLAWNLSAVGTVRLPTAARDSLELFLDRGRGDGQLDLEAGVYLAVSTPRFALRARGDYTLQQAAEIDVRVVPYGSVISGVLDIARADWNPGDRLAFEVEPALRVAPALSLAASYRFVRQGEDSFAPVQTTGLVPATDSVPGPSGSFYPDVSVLSVGTGIRLHELGGSLTYRSTGLAETTTGGFEAFLQLRKAVSGSGGRVPAGIRASFGLRLHRDLWGG